MDELRTQKLEAFVHTDSVKTLLNEEVVRSSELPKSHEALDILHENKASSAPTSVAVEFNGEKIQDRVQNVAFDFDPRKDYDRYDIFEHIDALASRHLLAKAIFVLFRYRTVQSNRGSTVLATPGIEFLAALLLVNKTDVDE
ncbi:hypothetical protein HDU97_002734 [Phlyctochytrium planicorne]|nr:hypothetical protein HDU97_002734 [Phlyctochytrium planicorne]